MVILLLSAEAINSQEFRPVVLKHKNLGDNPKKLHRTTQFMWADMNKFNGQRSRKITAVFTFLEVQSTDFCSS